MPDVRLVIPECSRRRANRFPFTYTAGETAGIIVITGYTYFSDHFVCLRFASFALLHTTNADECSPPSFILVYLVRSVACGDHANTGF